MQQVPEDEQTSLPRRSYHRREARKVEAARRCFDQVPAQAIARHAHSLLDEAVIILGDETVMASAADEIESAAVVENVSGAFKTTHEETGEEAFG